MRAVTAAPPGEATVVYFGSSHDSQAQRRSEGLHGCMANREAIGA